ncbi:MAG: hypothetical protein FWG20_00880 [Candidatus Cloacimonetes bacterium]|nr:hypothetical protein [Candidatus Cloacimonadota bacterium]
MYNKTLYLQSKLLFGVTLLLFLSSMISLLGAENFSVKDFPNDDGRKLIIEFHPRFLEAENIQIYRSFDNQDFQVIFTDPTETKLIDEFEGYHTTPVFYKIEVVHKWIDLDNPPSVEVYQTECTPVAQWFDRSKAGLLILLLVFCGAVLHYIYKASKGKEYYIRKINGLEAMEEAVGRAAEMGRPILFVPGISDINDIQTLSALTILGKLAEKVAEYHTKLIVPCRNSLVMVAAKDIVKESYLKAGYPEEFKSDDIFYLTDDQFGYVAGIDGIMLREKPATNFLLGAFWAESLILAETGFSIGAIQISGTAQPAQIPFFVAACDYTLIGEELFTASAYLSKNPQQIGSLKGQDFGKMIVMALIIVGVLLEICGVTGLREFLTLG